MDGTGLNHITRALRHRNYRLFFGGQSISLIGTWITRIATSWLVYRLTGSELLLGVVGFCSSIPLLILAPFAGVLVDRNGTAIASWSSRRCSWRCSRRRWRCWR